MESVAWDSSSIGFHLNPRHFHIKPGSKAGSHVKRGGSPPQDISGLNQIQATIGTNLAGLEISLATRLS